MSWLAGVVVWHHSAAAAGWQLSGAPELFPEKLQLFSEKLPLFPEKRTAELRGRLLLRSSPRAESIARSSYSVKGDTEQRTALPLTPYPLRAQSKGGGSRDKKCADSTMLLRGVSDVYNLYTDILIAL